MVDMHKYISESNKIEGIFDPTEDTQSMLAWDFISSKASITHDVIKKTQKMITLHQEELAPNMRGYYRDVSKTIVTVGGRLCAAPLIVPMLMDNIVLDMKDWRKQDPVVMHIRFEKVHPFVDGNGRTGRMILWWHQLKLAQTPTLFLNSKKHEEYYRLFK